MPKKNKQRQKQRQKQKQIVNINIGSHGTSRDLDSPRPSRLQNMGYVTHVPAPHAIPMQQLTPVPQVQPYGQHSLNWSKPLVAKKLEEHGTYTGIGAPAWFNQPQVFKQQTNLASSSSLSPASLASYPTDAIIGPHAEDIPVDALPASSGSQELEQVVRIKDPRNQQAEPEYENDGKEAEQVTFVPMNGVVPKKRGGRQPGSKNKQKKKHPDTYDE
jgi:hypothetical protein